MEVGGHNETPDHQLYAQLDEASTHSGSQQQPLDNVALDPVRVKQIMSRARFGRRSLAPGEVSALQKKRAEEMRRRSGDDPATRNARVADRFSTEAASTQQLRSFAEEIEPGKKLRSRFCAHY
eukprot:SAG31_NODE_5046_length_2778_cov_4.430758_1_plen_123_part_00